MQRGAHPTLQSTLCVCQSLRGCERHLQGTSLCVTSPRLLTANSSTSTVSLSWLPHGASPDSACWNTPTAAGSGGLSPIKAFHPDPWLSLCDGTESKHRARPAISFHKEWNSFSTPQRCWDSSLVTQPILKHRQKSLLRTTVFFYKWIPEFTIFIHLLLLSCSSATEVSCKDGISENKRFGILTPRSLLELILKAGEAEWKRKGNSGKWKIY